MNDLSSIHCCFLRKAVFPPYCHPILLNETKSVTRTNKGIIDHGIAPTQQAAVLGPWTSELKASLWYS